MPLLGAIIGAISQHNANKQNIKLAREQMAWSEKMWNMENEYNSPQATLQRFKDAGMNPNLIASQVSGGYAGSPNQYQAARVAPLISAGDASNALSSAIALYQNKMHLDNETKLTDSQSDLQFAKMLNELANNKNIKLTSRNMELINDFLERTFEDRVQNVGLQNELTETQIKVNKGTYDNIHKQMQLIDKNMEQIDFAMDNQKQITKAQIEYWQKSAYNGYLNACAALRNAASNEVMSSAAMKNATAHEKEVEIERLYKEKLGQQLDAQIKLLYQQYGFNDKKFDTELALLKKELLLKGEQVTFAEWQNNFNRVTMPAQVAQLYGNASGTWQNNLHNSLLFQNQLVGGILSNFNNPGVVGMQFMR